MTEQHKCTAQFCEEPATKIVVVGNSKYRGRLRCAACAEDDAVNYERVTVLELRETRARIGGTN